MKLDNQGVLVTGGARGSASPLLNDSTRPAPTS